MKMFIFWALAFAAVEAALSYVQFRRRKRTVKRSVRVILTAVKLLVSFAFAAIVMGGPVFFRPVQPLMVIVYAVLLPDAAADIVYGMYRLVRKRKRRFAVSKALSLTLGVLFFVYGTVNMQVVRPDRYTYASPKLTQTHKIVFVADLHVGSAQPMAVTEKTVEAIRDEKPAATLRTTTRPNRKWKKRTACSDRSACRSTSSSATMRSCSTKSICRTVCLIPRKNWCRP